MYTDPFFRSGEILRGKVSASKPNALFNFIGFRNEVCQSIVISAPWFTSFSNDHPFSTTSHKQMCGLKNKKPTRCHLLFYGASYRLNMFRALLCPSSGARDNNVNYHIGKAKALACSPDTAPTKPHLTSNLQQTKNETTNVVINIIVASS